ncbi:MAG: VWA domain-containing protein [Parcubacteria group bacterium]|nr:VWA domain-containing protein [Parcubacteria group bacterium]
MSIESREPQFKVESPPEIKNSEVARAERDLNEIIPILAHGLVRRIEQKGFSGKVRVRATAGDQWGVAKSPDNPTDVPNVIIYPRESLSGDKRLTNARLRHEIGNLNYPIDAELNGLRDWCETHDIAPELLTSLVEATHEASVNYLEMQNSHSDRPEENFRALYEYDINTQQIADGIGQSAPYKQAVDIALLYSLSQTGLISKEQFEQALGSADSSVQEIFDKQTRSVLDQTVKMAVPKKQVQLVRDYLWPKFSKLIPPPSSARGEVARAQESEAKSKKASKEVTKTEKGKETSATQAQMHEIQERLQKMMEKMREHRRQQKQTPKSQQQKPRQERKQERKTPQQKELSAAEKQERAEEENLLAKNLQEQLQTAKDQLEQLQKPEAKPEAKKPQEKPSSMEEIGKQAEQMKQEAEQAMREAKETGADEITEEQLQKLKEQLEQLEEVAKQIAESGALEKELAKPEEEPMTYNIKEYGINEAELTSEQLENLQKTRVFAQNTSKVYRTAMHLLMIGYQQKNPKFTDKMMQKMIERSYDLPDFSLYGSRAADEFLSKQQELGIDGFSDNFLVNFQLPRPLAKFWYKGGNGSKSVPVKEGEIEWGHFYRMCMPVIYNGVDRAQMSGLYLNRLNQFGQHDPKKYYYLWETIDLAQEKQKQENEALKEMQEQLKEMKEKLDEMNEQSGKSDEKDDQAGQSGEKSESSKQKSNEQKQSVQEKQSSEQGENKPSAQELKKQIDELKKQVDQMIKDAEERGDQAAADELKEMKEQLEQMSKKLEKDEQGEKGESGEQGEGQESEGQEGESGESEGQGESSQGKGSGQSGSGQGQGQGEGAGEGGQGGSQGGQPGKGMGQGGGQPQPGGQKGMGQGPGQPGGAEGSGEMGGGMTSPGEMKELMDQMQEMLNQAKEQGGVPGGQEAIQQMLDELASMQESLQSGASPQELAKQMSEAMQKMSEMMGGEEGGEPGQDGQEQGQQSESGGASGQESSGEGSEQSEGESGEQSHDQFQKGGKTHEGAVEGMFSKPNEELLKQLRQAEEMVGSKFTTQDESGNLVARDMSQSMGESLKAETSQLSQAHVRQMETLEELKRQQQSKMEAMYREMSGLDGETLRVYVDYMESLKNFRGEFKEFLIKKLKLDKKYLEERNKTRGSRMQRDFQRKIVGKNRDGKLIILPTIMKRKRPPSHPNICFSVIIDNSGSCSGEIIEQEKRVAVNLIELADELDINLEIVTFGGPDQFTFLKTFEQNIAGDDLQKVVLLNADQGTPDVVTLDAACTSMEKFTDKFRRSYNFVYFMTDGQSGSGSIQEVIKKHKKDMVITGIGMAGAAQNIAQTWGRNAVEVPEVKKLSDAFIRKVEDQIDQTFD